jgi:diguanylate cyclase (GGDEF)-like protein
MFQREHYFRQLLTSLQHLITYHQNQGDFKKAQEYAFRQVTLAPLEENAHRQLMTLLVHEGRRSAALEQYETCRRILENELGVDPDIETTALYEKIKSGQPIKGKAVLANQVQTNLPTQFTRFVGREAEIAWVMDCLDGGIYRLIAIVGMAGVGKTRLGIQVGSTLLNRFPDGVWFIPLSAVDSIDAIAPAVMAAMGNLSEGNGSTERLLRHLRGKEALLIIDNFEHLLSGAELLFAILRSAPKVIILVTSQQRMNYQAVSSLYLRGLPYPQDPSENDLLNFAAIKLFVSRANNSLPGFQIDKENAHHILRICKLVDGLPLGIELAAASIRNYSCQQIAEDLQQNLGILNTTMRDVPERHRSIRAAFSHSWNLLTDEEKDAYRKLSIFQREFSLDAAFSTTGASIQIISSLADKSLIQINSSGFYSIQPLLRQFATEKLAEYVDAGSEISYEENGNPSIPTFDPVTGLPNKILFRYSLQNAISRARRSQQKLILMLVEIDIVGEGDSKTEKLIYNQTIKSFANYLKERVRESDVVAHLLKGKFAILLEGLNNPNAGPVVSRKILNNIHIIESLPPKISVRLGFSVYPDDSSTVDDLFKIAGTRFFEAKPTE